ncbi:MAG: hypothetical protein ABI053_06585, partial [Lacisediminihabitans sp.]
IPPPPVTFTGREEDKRRGTNYQNAELDAEITPRRVTVRDGRRFARCAQLIHRGLQLRSVSSLGLPFAATKV